MAVSMVRCKDCRGLGWKRGMGAIEKDCITCDATGKVEQKSGCETISLLPEAGKVELVSLEEIFPGVAAIAKEIEAEVVNIEPIEPKVEPEAIIESIEPIKKKEIENDKPKPIFAGYSDALMVALLEEKSMAGPAWKQKHKNNNELFVTSNGQIIGEILDVRDRASIRELYAMSKPVAPRKVNLSAAQDMAASSDPQYMKYEKEMQAKAQQESKSQKKSGGM